MKQNIEIMNPNEFIRMETHRALHAKTDYLKIKKLWIGNINFCYSMSSSQLPLHYSFKVLTV